MLDSMILLNSEANWIDIYVSFKLISILDTDHLLLHASHLVNNIKQSIENLGIKNEVHVKLSEVGRMLTISVLNVPSFLYGDRANITELANIFSNIVEHELVVTENHLNFDKVERLVRLRCLEIPTHEIDWSYVYLIPVKGSSLQGVNRSLKRCSSIIIYNPEHVVSHVLGLVPLGRSVRFSGEAPWTSIVIRHLDTGDMLACQEELIESGFVEHAQL